MYRHDPQQTGRSPFVGPSKGILRAVVPGGARMTGIILDNDSIFYIGARAHEFAPNFNNITAYHYSGRVLWNKKINMRSGFTSPLLSAGGIIYFFPEFSVYAFKPDTIINWVFTPPRNIISVNPLIDKEGNLYIGDSRNTIYCISPTGVLLWEFTDQRIISGVIQKSFSPDGKTIYIKGNSSTGLAAFDVDRKIIKWTTGTLYGGSAPIVDVQGNIYYYANTDSVDKNSRTLYSYAASGALRWNQTISASYPDFLNDPTIDINGNIYIAFDTLYSYTNDGRLRWKYGFESGEYHISSLICDINGTVYICTGPGTVYAITEKGTLQWKVHIIDGIFNFGIAGALDRGTLFLSTDPGGKIFIIE